MEERMNLTFKIRMILVAVAISSVLLSPQCFAFDKNGKGNISVVCTGFHNDTGMAMISLFGSKDGFPGNTEKALRLAEAKIMDGKAAFIFKDVPYGTYAISVYHDENANKILDTGWLGIPKEGVGASNNQKSKFGPPSFKQSKFVFGNPELTVNIETRYVN